MGDVANQLAVAFASLRNALTACSTNGLGEFSAIAHSLQSDVVDKYTQRNTLSILDDIEADPAITVLQDVTANFEVLRELRAQLDFRGKDVVDLHLLASMIKDRRENMAGPALLVSHNKKEFDPRKNKVPEALYDCARLLWRGDFDLQTGVGQWQSRFGTQGP